MKAPNRLILSGYGPLAVVIALLLIVTLTVPSRSARDAAAVTAAGSGVGPGTVPGAAPQVPGAVGDTIAPGPAAGGPAVAQTAAGDRGGPGTTAARDARGGAGKRAGAGRAGGSAAGTDGPAVAGARPAGGGVRAAENCEGGRLQVAISAYSPTCLTFSGDNGGATSRGVTADTITVALRDNDGNDDREEQEEQDSELAKKAEEAGLSASEADRDRELDTLVDYFNSHYELYGRKVKLVRYAGRGSTATEIGGAGQEAANADAVKVAQEIKAFADLSASTQPYLDALVRQKVVSIGGLHLPASHYQARAPYAWGQLVDCTTLLGSAVDLLAKRLPATGKATRAGSAGMREQPRKYGLLFPDDAVYSKCIDEARPKLKAAGITIAKEIRYGLDFAKLQREAPTMAAQLKNAGVTTLILATDPLLPFFLTGAATQQGYYPEWFVTGTIGTDADVAGQFYDQDQWQNAIGQSYLTGFGSGGGTEAYKAFAAMKNGQPTALVDLTYQTLMMLFIGLQQAGPNLNPQAFADGMFRYGSRVGEYGRWSFSPTDFTTTDDAREFYFDPKAISPFNKRPGRCVPVNRGQRYQAGSWPARGQAPVPPAVAP